LGEENLVLGRVDVEAAADEHLAPPASRTWTTNGVDSRGSVSGTAVSRWMIGNSKNMCEPWSKNTVHSAKPRGRGTRATRTPGIHRILAEHRESVEKDVRLVAAADHVDAERPDATEVAGE